MLKAIYIITFYWEITSSVNLKGKKKDFVAK